MSAEKVVPIIPHKTCAKCGESKPHSEYQRHSDGGLQPRCKPCRNKDYRNARGNDADKRKTVNITENGRNCLQCGEIKNWDEFANDKFGFNQKTANCKDCRSKNHQKHYQNNPKVKRSGLKNRPDKLMRLYGVTYGDIVKTLSAQFGRCANHGCGKEISLEAKCNAPNRAVIDHDHKTGKFRAVLCSECNLGLGMIEKSEIRFLGLMEYKTKHS